MRSIFLKLGKATIACAITVILIILIILSNSSVRQNMAERADLKAFCDSVGGNLGENQCFVNGVEVKQ